MSAVPAPVRIRVARPDDAATLLELKHQLDRETAVMMYKPDERDSHALTCPVCHRPRMRAREPPHFLITRHIAPSRLTDKPRRIRRFASALAADQPTVALYVKTCKKVDIRLFTFF